MDPIYLWLILAAALFAIELVTGTFVLMFFGIGALLTAPLPFLGLTSPSLQIVFFAAVSTLGLLLFRKSLLLRFQGRVQNSVSTSDVGHRVFLEADLAAGGAGTVVYQGSPWRAVNLEPIELKKGTQVQIDRIEGVTLFVRKV